MFVCLLFLKHQLKFFGFWSYLCLKSWVFLQENAPKNIVFKGPMNVCVCVGIVVCVSVCVCVNKDILIIEHQV